MFPTYELIASQTLGSNASSVTFSGIPQTYDDLVAVVSARANRTVATAAQPGYLQLKPNGATTSQSIRALEGNGASASSYTSTTIYCICPANSGSWTSSTFGFAEFYIPNYAGSTNKSMSIFAGSENNNATTFMGAVAALWSSTAAITSLEFTELNANGFVTNSSFWLFGIREETA